MYDPNSVAIHQMVIGIIGLDQSSRPINRPPKAATITTKSRYSRYRLSVFMLSTYYWFTFPESTSFAVALQSSLVVSYGLIQISCLVRTHRAYQFMKKIVFWVSVVGNGNYTVETRHIMAQNVRHTFGPGCFSRGCINIHGDGVQSHEAKSMNK